MNNTSTPSATPSARKAEDLKTAIKILADKLGQTEAHLFLNNILCLTLQEFEGIILQAKDNDRRAMAIFTSNTFVDYILDRLNIIGLCSSATNDMTLHECKNLLKRINGSSDDDTDSLDATEE